MKGIKKQTVFSILYCLILLESGLVFGAPISPIGPMDITGVIEEVRWFPEMAVKGIPRMSGSAGKDRVVSPHFLIRLVDYEGATLEKAVTMTRYLDWSAFQNQKVKNMPPFILLKIDYSDRNYLKKGMRIKVSGYKIAGDEGGTWATFTGIEILKNAPL